MHLPRRTVGTERPALPRSLPGSERARATVIGGSSGRPLRRMAMLITPPSDFDGSSIKSAICCGESAVTGTPCTLAISSPTPIFPLHRALPHGASSVTTGTPPSVAMERPTPTVSRVEAGGDGWPAGMLDDCSGKLSTTTHSLPSARPTCSRHCPRWSTWAPVRDNCQQQASKGSGPARPERA
jgi:hypothetical protein